MFLIQDHPMLSPHTENSPFISTVTKQFIEILNTIVPLPADFTEQLQQVIAVQRLPKGTLLLAEGQVCDKLFFIYEGLVRSYYFEEGQEFTSRIVAENDFIYAPFSYINQKASFETIQLLENSTIICIQKKDAEALYKNFPQAAYLSLKITERHLLLCDNKSRFLRLSAKDRLSYFKKHYPHLALRVQISHLATYLGLSRSCLSHLRTQR